MPKITTPGRLAEKRKEYAKKYSIGDLESGNDKSNLEMLLNLELTLEDLTADLHNVRDDTQTKDKASAVATIIKTMDTLIETKLKIERSLGIDRKSRKTEDSAESPAEYIKALKIHAKEFLDLRMQRVMCDTCKIQLFKFLPTYDHNKFDLKIYCPQCGKYTRVHRVEKSILWDLPAKDKAWREKYPMEIIPAKNNVAVDEEDEMVIG